jgi:hypothetical protein
VFLQPGLKVKSADGPSQSVMADSKTGFQSYLVTDGKTLDSSKHACLAVRGSDDTGNVSLSNFPKEIKPNLYNIWTDWIANDAVFAFGDMGIAQSKDAELTLKASISTLPKNVKLDVTGHSLGTMVSAQGVARLLKDAPQAFDHIGKVVLWDGPDTTQSLKNMGLSQAQIRAVSNKITYYVNPMDVVSMLNRTAPISEQLGHVKYVVPLNFHSTLEAADSAHDFGEYQ